MSGFRQDPINLDARELSAKEKFYFKCNSCGNCCRYRHNGIQGTEIVLSGPDIKRIESYTNMPLEEMIGKYIYISFDADLKLKVCCLKFKYSGCCAFLKNGKCSIYEARPRTCAIYPVGRAINFSQVGKQFVYINDTYVINSKEPEYKCCYSNVEQYTVEEWFQENGVPIHDTHDILWFKKMAEYSYQANKKKLSTKEIEEIFSDLYM